MGSEAIFGLAVPEQTLREDAPVKAFRASATSVPWGGQPRVAEKSMYSRKRIPFVWIRMQAGLCSANVPPFAASTSAALPRFKT